MIRPNQESADVVSVRTEQESSELRRTGVAYPPCQEERDTPERRTMGGHGGQRRESLPSGAAAACTMYWLDELLG